MSDTNNAPTRATPSLLDVAVAAHPDIARQMFDAIHDRLLTAGIPGVYGKNGCTTPAVNAAVAICIEVAAAAITNGSAGTDR